MKRTRLHQFLEGHRRPSITNFGPIASGILSFRKTVMWSRTPVFRGDRCDTFIVVQAFTVRCRRLQFIADHTEFSTGRTTRPFDERRR
ncbi:hypothetical protein EA473_01755 [Natrarchaeobius chitinivorans]|uniref:Uncharacterized protein n=1 Tax=Natrarchaeobius chitinivorans TaxID=1679083 RepID=A0A3N6M3A1_NATCH|nr:hypothetical protein EA473_01755 [Natrarchaeobius chitinivorans]